MDIDTFYTSVFWIATVSFFALSALLIFQTNLGTTLHLQVFMGVLIFASSKIGRRFLGLI